MQNTIYKDSFSAMFCKTVNGLRDVSEFCPRHMSITDNSISVMQYENEVIPFNILKLALNEKLLLSAIIGDRMRYDVSTFPKVALSDSFKQFFFTIDEKWLKDRARGKSNDSDVLYVTSRYFLQYIELVMLCSILSDDKTFYFEFMVAIEALCKDKDNFQARISEVYRRILLAMAGVFRLSCKEEFIQLYQIVKSFSLLRRNLTHLDISALGVEKLLGAETYGLLFTKYKRMGKSLWTIGNEPDILLQLLVAYLIGDYTKYYDLAMEDSLMMRVIIQYFTTMKQTEIINTYKDVSLFDIFLIAIGYKWVE